MRGVAVDRDSDATALDRRQRARYRSRYRSKKAPSTNDEDHANRKYRRITNGRTAGAMSATNGTSKRNRYTRAATASGRPNTPAL